MDISKPKLILIIIGSAISGVIIFILSLWGIAFFVSFNEKNVTVITDTPPPLEKPISPQYLGTHQITSGKFDSMSQKELAQGPGAIVGKVLVDGRPSPGLRLRLALNGSVWTHWTVTNNKGEYKVQVPFGEYRVDGWNLDEKTPDIVMPGRIHNPTGIFTMFNSFIVNEQKTGKGPILSFIPPVKIIQPVGEVQYSDDLILEWEPYPNATYYKIQIEDYGDGQSFVGKRLYKLSNDQPKTKDTKLYFKDIDANLIAGHYYSATIWALDKNWAQISKSVDNSRFGFLVTN